MAVSTEIFEELFDELEKIQVKFLDEKSFEMEEKDFFQYVTNGYNGDLAEISEKWSLASNEILGGSTPAQIFENIDIEDIKKAYEIIIKKDILKMPSIFEVKINSNWAAMVEYLAKTLSYNLAKITSETEFENIEESVIPSAMSVVELFANNNSEEAVNLIVSAFYDIRISESIDECEWKFEFLTDLLYASGGICINKLKQQLLSINSFELADEYLIVALSRIAAGIDDPEIYNILRTFFRESQIKSVPAFCLGDFGDAKAITLLRTYVENNKDDIQEQDLYDLLATIKKLGGDISDFVDF